ncbi:serine hydrolase domain-containing protein [Steroidobacter sp.]|uniref:serine hydrolase domain-containing protein n=1 Tax=Steroidobacter sp. TaxID=1978227 RepID=UPI001A47EE9D|nr:serine hydrolase domain-containing protein [Steroidobacter sp.]MBL8267968.1 beta-lactamase family protein [Steroidobacter sp.]
MGSTSIRLSWVAIAAVSAFAAPVLAQPAPEQLRSHREAVLEHLRKKDVPSASIAVWQDGQIIWEEGFGWADRAKRMPATEHTMYMLASLSKTLTATAMMTLVQAGKVDLDKPVNDYLGDDKIRSYVGNPKDITVRNVANHTSGLPGSDQWFYGDEMSQTPAFSQTIHRYGFAFTAPGERYRYSNLGYGVLGHLLGKVSGVSYGDFMQQALFTPLGMTHSALDITPGFEQLKAQRYNFRNQPIPNYLSAEPASATLYSSAHDLARFGMFILKNRLPDQRSVLTDANIDAMTRDAPKTSATAAYGVGWVVNQLGGYRAISHSGSASGVSSNFILLPERNMGIVMLANIDGGVSTEIQRQVLKTLSPGWKEPAAQSSTAAANDSFKPKADLIGRWEGKVHTYEGDQPMQLTVQADGDVHIRIGGEPKFANRSVVQLDTLLNGVSFKDGQLTGKALSQIETSDTARHPHTVSLELTLRGQVLNGSTSATSIFDGLWIYGLPHWTELKKVASR